MDGVFAVYKQKGFTSNDTLNQIKKILRPFFGKKIKVGHGGTLDKNAQGVLVIGIGKGCKQLQHYLSGDKSYQGIGVFGQETDTLDATGEIIKTCETKHITEQNYVNILPTFEGEIDQIPPKFSALKIKGKRVSDIVRNGQEVKMNPRKVTIYQVQNASFNLPKFEIIVRCGGGTYIRSLIRDIGEKLGSCAYMYDLIRTKQGMFAIEDTLSIDDLSIESIRANLRFQKSKDQKGDDIDNIFFT
jgi:tRNA pseudouridine55 synthase